MMGSFFDQTCTGWCSNAKICKSYSGHSGALPVTDRLHSPIARCRSAFPQSRDTDGDLHECVPGSYEDRYSCADSHAAT
jgi:hypothetical protein